MAQEYGKVDTCVWTDGKFRALSPPAPCAQVLWLYLLAPRERTMVPGLIPVGIGTIAETLRWPYEATAAAFEEVREQGMADFDASGPLLWLPNAIKRNLPSNPNQVKGWGEDWNTIPDCPLKRRAWLTLREAIEAKGEAFARAFTDTWREPPAEPSQVTVHPNRSVNGSGARGRNRRGNGRGNQKQEQKQEQKLEAPPPASAREGGEPLAPEAAESVTPPSASEAVSGAAVPPPASGLAAVLGAPLEPGYVPEGFRRRDPDRELAVDELPGADGVFASTGRLSPLPRRDELLDERHPLTAEVLRRCAAGGWVLGHAKNAVSRGAVERAVELVTPPVAASRLLAFVAAERAQGREPQPFVGWHLHVIQGGRPGSVPDIRVGHSAPAPAEAFQEGEHELRT